ITSANSAAAQNAAASHGRGMPSTRSSTVTACGLSSRPMPRAPSAQRRARPASGRAVYPQVAELAVERRAADAETAGDFGHPPAVVADGEADHVGLDVLERAQVAVGGVEIDPDPVLRRMGGHLHLAENLAQLREVLGGQRVAVAEHCG